VGSSLTASGAGPMGVATPLLVADVLDIFVQHQLLFGLSLVTPVPSPGPPLCLVAREEGRGGGVCAGRP
jgi:hypothetical protein